MYNGYNVGFVKDRFGNPNSAIRFIDGYYQVPTGVYFKGDFTISLWLKTNLFVSYSNILEFTNGQYLVSINSNSYDRFIPQLKISFYYSDSYVYSSQFDILKGQWTHLVTTLSGTTGSFYINGMLVGQSFNMFIPRNVNRTSNFIGKNSWNYYGNLWADLDDLRIYDRALSQTEIYDLLSSPSTSYVFNTSTTTTTTNKPASTTSKPPISSQTRYTNGLVNYWPIDYHVNDTVSKANMYNGVNVEFVEDRFGNPNSAIRFTEGYYQVPSGVYFNGDFTISLWVKLLNSYSYDQKIISFTNDVVGDDIYLSYYSNQASLYSTVSYSQSTISSSIPFLYRQWTHLVATLSGTTGSIYLNGMLAGKSNNMLIPRNIYTTSNYIGNGNNYGLDLDDLRIYNKSMNQSDVYNLFIEAPFNYEFYQSKFVLSLFFLFIFLNLKF
jgi:hypothetical protein